MALEPRYTPRVGRVLDQLEADPNQERLWNAVCDAIDLVCEHPDSAEARRQSARVDGPNSRETVWIVPIRRAGENWVLLWQQVGEDAVFTYLGSHDKL